MGDSNYKTWALVLLLALAGVWQLSKSFTAPAGDATRSERDWDAVNQADRDLDEPYSEPGRPGRPRHPHGPPPGVVHTAPRPTELSPQELAKFIQSNKSGEVVDSAKKKSDDEKCTPKTDPKTGKTIPCRKKKKKKDKKDDDKIAAPTPVKPVPTTPHDPTPSADIITGVGAAIKTGQLNVNPTASTGTPSSPSYDGLDQWEAKLLGTPSLSATKDFIAAFQKNQVSSTIFYTIAQKMLNDSREDMKLLGVMCAGVNQSAQGFSMLATYASGATAGAQSATQANAALEKYTTLATLPILASVMRSASAPAPTVTAMQKVDETAKNLLVAGANVGTAGAPNAIKGAGNAAAFTKFVPILQGLAKNSNAQIKAQATTTLADLQALLGTTSSINPGGLPNAPNTSVTPQSIRGRGAGGPPAR